MHKTHQRILITAEFAKAILEVNQERMKETGHQQRRDDPAIIAEHERNLINGTLRYPQGCALGFTGKVPSGITELTLAHISTIGACINGIQRLNASRNTGKSFYADVWTECPLEYLIGIWDKGTRTLRHTLEITNNVPHNKSALIKSMVYRAARMQIHKTPTTNHALSLTDTELNDFYSQNKDRIEEASEIAKLGKYYQSVFGLFYFVFSEKFPISTKKFSETVQLGLELEPGSIEVKVRNKLFDKRQMDKLTRRPDEALRILFFAMNKYLEGDNNWKNFKKDASFEVTRGPSLDAEILEGRKNVVTLEA